MAHATPIAALVRRCPPLDVNSGYLYLLLCHHFSQTCVVAECDRNVIGFLSAYFPPANSKGDADPRSHNGPSVDANATQPLNNVLFVWQVAVDPSARRRGLAAGMLTALLARPVCRSVRFVEATVSPSNQPSTRLFEALARQTPAASCRQTPLFTRDLFSFSDPSHEEEMLLRIGPIDPLQMKPGAPQPTEAHAS